MFGCKMSKEKGKRRNHDHLENREETSCYHGDQRHCCVLPAMRDIDSPELECYGEESADERRDDPCRGVRIRLTVGNPEGIAMDDR